MSTRKTSPPHESTLDVKTARDKWAEYERQKAIIRQTSITQREYDERVDALVDQLEI